MARVAFVQNLPLDYPDVTFLSAALKASGHEVELFPYRNQKRVVRELTAWVPDIVGFNILTCNSGETTPASVVQEILANRPMWRS
jgi:hypothetical protein